MTAQAPMMETIANGYRCDFHDGSMLEAENIRQVRQQWYGTVAAIHAGNVLHRADFALLNQREQGDFHRAASSLNGHFQWHARLHALITGILAVERTPEADPAARPIVPALQVAVEPFPVQVLPGPMQALVHEGARAMPCPADFIAVHLLAVGGACVGNRLAIRLKPGWIEQARIYAGIVAEPGSKKSPAQELAVRPLYDYQQELHEIFKVESQEYERKVEAYKVALAVWKSEARKDQGTVGDPPSKPPLPTMAQVWTSDATVEAFAEILAQNPSGIILIRDELSAWVLSMNQYKGGHGADRQHWLSFWNGAAVLINRKRQIPIVIPHPFACVSGCLPPDVLPDLTDQSGRNDGFLDRILLAYPDPIPAAYTDAYVDPATAEQYSALLTTMRQVGAQAEKTVLEMTPGGHTTFVRFMAEINDQMNSPDCPLYLRGPLAKMPGYTARLALILAVARTAADETREAQVDAVSVKGAAELVRYFISHARRVYPCLQITDEDKRVEAAYAWIKAHGGTATARAIVTAGVSGVKTADEAKALLQLLADRGHGRVEDKPRGQVEFSILPEPSTQH